VRGHLGAALQPRVRGPAARGRPAHARRGGAAALGLAALALAAPAPSAARDWTVASPDRDLRATVSQTRPGAPLRLLVRRDGRRVLAVRLAAADRFRASARARVSEDFTTPAGKRRVHRLRARELTLRFAGLRLQLRVANDGIAHRTILGGRGRVTIDREPAAFALPRHATAWLQRLTGGYESAYVPRRVRATPAGRWGFPALVDAGHGTRALLTEADVDGRYAAAHLRSARSRPGELRIELPARVRTRLPLRTPWRVAVIGSLARVVGSDLPLALGAPSRIRDTAWIRPGRAAWSWWSNSNSPWELDTQKRYVDYAAARGWEYVLVDEGWDGAWVTELVGYAGARGVGILLWARYSDVSTAAKRRARLPRWKRWGIAGLKLDFIGSDRQRQMGWYDDVAREAAALQLVLNFHGTTVPRGIQRTWPNVLTLEGVGGAEHYKSASEVHPTPAGNATLPFTRNVIGSMDYTPVTFSAAGRTTTDAHELALAVVFESGLQHFADRPAAYAQRPAAERFLSAVPAAWDDTRLLDGYPGRFATLARRHGEDWFVGAIAAEPRTLTAPLGFLAPGRTYEATIVRDAPGGGLSEERRTVRRGDRLVIPATAGGGFAARIAPAAG
jgi:alpha-glucosidase